LIGSIQNFLEENLTHNYLGIEVGLNLSFACTLGMVVKPLWKYGTYTLQLLFGPLWKHIIYPLQLMLAASFKAGNFALQLLLGAPLKV